MTMTKQDRAYFIEECERAADLLFLPLENGTTPPEWVITKAANLLDRIAATLKVMENAEVY